MLLAALVITGMAGTPKNTSLSQEERKFCLTKMRDSKNAFVHSLKELSAAQLNYRPTKDDPSIREYVLHIASAEKMLAARLQQAMNEQARPDQRAAIKLSDEELIRLASDPEYPVLAGLEEQHTMSGASTREAVEAFLSTRNEQVKYVRNTTEDLRNHIVQLKFGYIDCYQLLLLIPHYSNRYLQEINTIIGKEGFPRS
jgi:hypothetical protein